MQNRSRVVFGRVAVLCAAVVVICFATPAPAPHVADHPVRIVVPAAAGGGSDNVARALADKVGEVLGVRAVVENRVGGGGVIGVLAVKNATPDGGTILLTTSGPVTFPPSGANFDPSRDLMAVTQVGLFDLGIATTSAAPFGNIAELVAAARARPGSITYAVSGLGTLSHLLGASLAQTASINIQAIPYRGSAPAMADLVAGTISVVISPLADLLPLYRDGRVRILAKSGTQRSPLAPDVPTLAESGINVQITDWYGIFAPSGTPTDLINRLNQAATTALRSPETQQRLTAAGVRITATTPQALAEIQRADAQFWQNTARAAGIMVVQ